MSSPARSFRPAPLLALLLAASAVACPLSGQGWRQLSVVDVVPLAGVHRCTAPSDTGGEAIGRVLSARALEGESAKARLADLVDSLAAEAAARPEAVDTQYAFAAALGARADVEGGRAKVDAAKALYEQLGVVLALDPDHAGAHHLLGRLHAAVRRMDRVTRFVATRLLGGGALAGASWEEARARLEAAASGDPCVPDHHYELARLYAERGDPEAARERLDQLFALPDVDPAYARVWANARALSRELDERRAP